MVAAHAGERFPMCIPVSGHYRSRASTSVKKCRVGPLVHRVQIVASWTGIHCRSRQGEPGGKISIFFDLFAWTMLNGILVSCQELQVALYTRIMFVNFGELFECPVDGVDSEGHVEEILLKTLIG